MSAPVGRIRALVVDTLEEMKVPVTSDRIMALFNLVRDVLDMVAAGSAEEAKKRAK